MGLEPQADPLADRDLPGVRLVDLPFRLHGAEVRDLEDPLAAPGGIANLLLLVAPAARVDDRARSPGLDRHGLDRRDDLPDAVIGGFLLRAQRPERHLVGMARRGDLGLEELGLALRVL